MDYRTNATSAPNMGNHQKHGAVVDTHPLQIARFNKRHDPFRVTTTRIALCTPKGGAE